MIWTPRHFEEDLFVRAIGLVMPEPVRVEEDHIVGGDPGLVLIRTNTNSIHVQAYGIRWDRPHTPVLDPTKVASVRWRDLPHNAEQITEILKPLIDGAQALRVSTFRICSWPAL